VCFGGDEFSNSLFITTAAPDQDGQEGDLGGNIFISKVKVSGLLMTEYLGEKIPEREKLWTV
jgi:hypothetical protein